MLDLRRGIDRTSPRKRQACKKGLLRRARYDKRRGGNGDGLHQSGGRRIGHACNRQFAQDRRYREALQSI